MNEVQKSLSSKECSDVTGVSIRALRHYEKLGLITPIRAENGYRQYLADDVLRVVSIQLLKQFGMSLVVIKDILSGHETDLISLIQYQDKALNKERLRIERSLSFTKQVLAMMLRRDLVHLSDLLTILEVTNMKNISKVFEGMDVPELAKEQKDDLESRIPTLEEQEEISNRWSAVFAEAEALVGTDPQSPRATAMAQEAKELISMFTQGDPKLLEHAGSLWQGARNDPERAKMMPISEAGWDFLQSAQSHCE